MRISPYNKIIAVEKLPIFTMKKKNVGRYSLESRMAYYYNLAKQFKVKAQFVNHLFEEERLTGKNMSIGTMIRRKALGRTKWVKKQSIAVKTKIILNVKSRKQKCTLKTSPTCLNVFITSGENTVCVRCR